MKKTLLVLLGVVVISVIVATVLLSSTSIEPIDVSDPEASAQQSELDASQ